jgi:hypothetical protein
VATIDGVGLLVMVPFAAAFLGIVTIFGGLLMFGTYQRKSEKTDIFEFVRSIYRDVTVAG